MVAAVRDHHAHAIGMSGLLVKSTVVMKDNLEELSRLGVDVPILLGGAALTRNFVEDDCTRAYASGRVAYARDAFDGLSLMEKVTGNGFDEYTAAIQTKRAGKARNTSRTLGQADSAGLPARRYRHRAGPPPPADHGSAGDPDTALLGRADCGGAAARHRALPQRAQPLSVPVGIPETGPLAR